MEAGAQLNVPWFESPFFERELARSGLDGPARELVSSFAERGYVVIDLETPEFGRIADEIAVALEPEHGASRNRVQDAWAFVPAVRRLATEPKVLATLTTLYRRRPVPFQTINFKHGSQQDTHSDVVHFNSLPPRYMAGVWIALEDVRPESGPLHYYPGSHRLPVYELHDLGLSGSALGARDEAYAVYERFVRELLAASGLPKETVSLKQGQALIWSANLLHGGEPIEDPASTRRSQVVHCYFEGCRYYTPLHSDPPLGRYAWRRVIDIGSGREQPHVYAGRRVRVPLGTRVRYGAQDLMRRSRAGRGAIRAIRRLAGRRD